MFDRRQRIKRAYQNSLTSYLFGARLAYRVRKTNQKYEIPIKDPEGRPVWVYCEGEVFRNIVDEFLDRAMRLINKYCNVGG